MKVLIYAFGDSKNNISDAILDSLDIPSKFTFKVSKDTSVFDEQFKKLTELIDKYKITHIIGLGQYTSKDISHVKLETVCKNKFRNSTLGSQEAYNLDYQLLESLFSKEFYKLGKGMGNSWCNLATYKLNEKFKDLPVSFIHVPKNLEDNLKVQLTNSLMLAAGC